MFACNPTFIPVLKAPPEIRYVHLWGGRGRGGSHFATLYALACLMSPVYFRGYLMRAVHKDIRESLWRDLMDRLNDLEDQGQLNRAEFKVNQNEMSVLHLPTGNMIRSRGFRKASKGQTAKMKSIAGATHVFIEEFEEVEKEEFEQLDDSLRTVKAELKIICVFNPPKKNHWIIRRWYTLTEARIPGYYLARPKVEVNFMSIFSTYYNNRANIDENTATNFENYRLTNPEHYWTVIRGLVSEGAKGRIYRGWQTITNDDFNLLPYTSYYVLDFGFGGDPLALAEVKRHNRQRWAKELIYETGLSDDALIVKLRAFRVGGRPIVADSAEPKSIAKLRQAGFNVIAARKGPDSVRAGIKTMQSLLWAYTEDSTNLAYEYQEYRWVLDENKDLTDRPEDRNNHLLDALRYGEITDPWGGGAVVIS